MAWQARVVGPNGTQTIDIDSPNYDIAWRQASRRGTVVSLKKQRKFDLVPGMSAGDRYTFLVRLSSMLGSKVSTSEALRIIAASFGGSIRRAAQQLLQRVEAGFDLPTAMEMDRKNFPATLTALVRAGGEGGHAWKALKDAADFEYQLSQTRKTSNRGLWSAIGTFLIAGALMLGTTQVFGPWVMDNPMFKGNRAVDVGWIETSASILTVLMVILLIAFFGFVWLATIGRQMFPDFCDKIIVTIPYYRELVLAQNNYVTLYKLGLLIKSGVRIEESLRLTWEGCPRGALRTDINRALSAVRNGRNWGMAMETLHPTDRAALSQSTDREDVARTLDALAVQYRDLYVQRIATFSPALQLVAALFITLASGVLFGLTILPMLQLSVGLSSQ